MPEVLLGVCSGGHSQMACVDDAIMISLSQMTGISVDPDAKTLTCGGGCRLGELDAATAKHNMATTFGTYHDTGVGGLSLGAGVGRLIKKFGMYVCTVLLVVPVLAPCN